MDDITQKVRAMHAAGMGQRAICGQLKIGHHRMAHLIETMAYVNETPWHGLGNQLCTPAD